MYANRRPRAVSALMVLLTAALFGCPSRVIGDDEQPSSMVPIFPPDAYPGGIYTVQPEEANLTISKLVLPDDFTLTFDDRIENVKWTVDTLQFGQKATIDLSVPLPCDPIFTNWDICDALAMSLSVTGAHGKDQSGQPSWGQTGARGGDGGEAPAGRNGVGLKMTIRQVVLHGSLWICTDGATAGIGGTGGKGQDGGGSSCGWPFTDEPETRGGDGGPGGRGGAGGKAGNTAKVEIIVAPGIPLAPIRCGEYDGPSFRPIDANGDTGQVVISGSPGMPGLGGQSGHGGKGAGGRGCFPKADQSAGNDGRDGSRGPDGARGKCIR